MTESIFVVTNRAYGGDRENGYRLKDTPNGGGANTLRAFEARPAEGEERDWHLKLLPDRPRRKDFDAQGVAPARPRSHYRGSDLLAARLVQRLREKDRNLVVFIHGYNNTAREALDRARRLREHYGVEVLVFTWPANGGGDRFLEELHGKASYLSDKSDARASAGALDRMLARLQAQLTELNEGVRKEVEDEASAAWPDSREGRRAETVRLLRERACPFRVTLLAHSMGNYLYKKMLMSSEERLSRDTVFDNVILKAADANHADHAAWVRRIRALCRIYILINQEDDALRLSAMKIGDRQKPRLGNTLAEQNASGATYLDLTGYVGSAHSYFDAADLERENAEELTGFFRAALNGRIAESDLDYVPARSVYRPG